MAMGSLRSELFSILLKTLFGFTWATGIWVLFGVGWQVLTSLASMTFIWWSGTFVRIRVLFPLQSWTIVFSLSSRMWSVLLLTLAKREADCNKGRTPLTVASRGPSWVSIVYR